MITELTSRLGECLSFRDRRANLLLHRVDLFGGGEDRVFMGVRKYDDAP